MSLQYILMGDIIGSRRYAAEQLRNEFMGLISSCNKELQQDIFSPYTVTLGDEFQGVAASLTAAVKTIFYLEETSLRLGLRFKMRYVTVHGAIETPLNRVKAHTMMGAGLTEARSLLTDKGRGTPRFRFKLDDMHRMSQLNRLFLVVDGLTDRWNRKDRELILDMLVNTHNEDVGVAHGKNRSQIWKRRKNLLIEEYRALKESLLELAG